MSDIPSNGQYIQIEGTRLRSPTSESLFQSIGGTVNYLLDEDASRISDIAAVNARVDLRNIAFDASAVTATYGVGTFTIKTFPGAVRQYGLNVFSPTSVVPSYANAKIKLSSGGLFVCSPVMVTYTGATTWPLLATVGGGVVQLATTFYFTSSGSNAQLVNLGPSSVIITDVAVAGFY